MAFADTVKFTAGSSGTSDFSDGTAVTGFRPLSTGAVSGQTYSYRAFSADLSQWENGQGVYTSGSPGTLARTTQFETSTGSKVNFTTAPVVILTPLKADMDGLLPATTSAQGIVELATQTEAATLTDTSRAITSDGLFFLGGYTTTATAAGTTTLTVTSTYNQYFTGTTTQTVALPVVSTLTLGRQFTIVNNSTGKITVQSSGANTLQVMGAGTKLVLTVISTSGTGVASWDAQYLAPTTPWVSYTPTFTGFGTATSISMWSRRVGDSLEVRGYFTTGTVTAVEGRLSLGFNGTDGNVTSDSTKVAALQQAGPPMAQGTTSINSFQIYPLIESNVGYITFGVQSSTGVSLSKGNGSAVALNSTKYALSNVLIPIAGW